ncbi:hypothetical protein ACTA71_007604 [Dictyostelium dimigraforme]
MSTKLFVGQIPKSFNEEEIKNLFNNIANIESVSLIKNKATNEPQGCAFVSVPSREEADRAIEQLHNSKKFQGVLNNLQVKYADSEQEKLASKLFVGMLPRSYEEEQIRELFEPHGVVEDICILRGPNSESKGCGFIKFENRESALSAIATLNGMKLDGSPNPLVVKFADTEKDKKKKQKQQQIQIQMQQRQQQPPHQQPHQQSFQSQYQQPVVNQFPPKMNQQPFIVNPYFGQMPNFNFIPSIDSSPSLLGTPPIIGDGIYDIYSNSQFDNKYNNGNGSMGGNGGNNGNMYGRNFNNGNNGPMGNMNGNGINNGPMGNGMNNGPMGNMMNNGPMGNGLNNGPMGNGLNNNMGGQMGNNMNNGINQGGGPMGNKKNQSVGPQGSNLFVYNIPNYFSDNDLLGLFQQYGIVVSAKVYVDKNTGVSKGFGFVSYDNPSSANIAISNLNGQMMAGKKLKVSLKQASGQGSQPY